MVIMVIITAYHVTAVGVIEHFKYLTPEKGGENNSHSTGKWQSDFRSSSFRG